MKMGKVRIGIIGVTGRGKLYKHWHNPDGRSVVVGRADVRQDALDEFRTNLGNGIKASYQQCHFTPDYFRNYTFIETEGRMENLDDHSKVIVLTRDESKKWGNYANRTYEIKPAEGGHGGADSVICEDFIDMIISDKEPLAIPEAGRMSVATGCAATESSRNGGKVVEVPPLPL